MYVITHTNFFVNRFRGFGVLTSQNLGSSIGLADRSCVSTDVLHCDRSIFFFSIALYKNWQHHHITWRIQKQASKGLCF